MGMGANAKIANPCDQHTHLPRTPSTARCFELRNGPSLAPTLQFAGYIVDELFGSNLVPMGKVAAPLHWVRCKCDWLGVAANAVQHHLLEVLCRCRSSSSRFAPYFLTWTRAVILSTWPSVLSQANAVSPRSRLSWVYCIFSIAR